MHVTQYLQMLTPQALSSVWALLPPLNVLLFSAIIPEPQKPAAMQTYNYSVYCLEFTTQQRLKTSAQSGRNQHLAART
jgi:hypothetical protein